MKKYLLLLLSFILFTFQSFAFSEKEIAAAALKVAVFSENDDFKYVNTITENKITYYLFQSDYDKKTKYYVSLNKDDVNIKIVDGNNISKELKFEILKFEDKTSMIYIYIKYLKQDPSMMIIREKNLVKFFK